MSLLKEVKSLVVYDVECAMAMEPMQGKWASSGVNIGYTELFCVPEVTSEFFSSCDSVLGDSLLFHQANRGCLHACLGTRNCSARNAGGLGLISWRGGSVMGFLEFRQESGG